MLPIRPNLKRYGGAKPELRRKTAEYNRQAERVAEHVNRLIANEANEIQQWYFGTIAADLGVSKDLVRSAISTGGSNGITVRVTEDGRRALAKYRHAENRKMSS